jgi:hypothetical protein
VPEEVFDARTSVRCRLALQHVGQLRHGVPEILIVLSTMPMALLRSFPSLVISGRALAGAWDRKSTFTSGRPWTPLARRTLRASRRCSRYDLVRSSTE